MYKRFVCSKPFLMGGTWFVQVIDHWILLHPKEGVQSVFNLPLDDWVCNNHWHLQFIKWVNGQPTLVVEEIQ